MVHPSHSEDTGHSVGLLLITIMGAVDGAGWTSRVPPGSALPGNRGSQGWGLGKPYNPPPVKTLLKAFARPACRGQACP